MPTPHFNFKLADYYSTETFLAAAGTNQINYNTNGEEKPLTTSGATDPNPQKSITTWSYSDIMQGAASVRPTGATYDVFNQNLSGGLVDVLKNSDKGGVNALLTSREQSYSPYDVITQAKGQGPSLNDVISGGLNNNGQTGTTTDPNVAGATGLARTAVATAHAQLGKPYVSGGIGPDTFDCSGLMQYCWAQAGITIPHVTWDQYPALDPITKDQLKPGDIIYYHGFGHCAMWIGGGPTEKNVIHAPHTGDVVRTEVSDYIGDVSGYGRPKGASVTVNTGRGPN